MQSRMVRDKFFAFFVQRGHTIVPSSSLIPADDPTLLFANAGMNQFKDVFLGREQRTYTRAASIQKCIRAGGKHNDLDNVGFTARHLTFFEMMGNFSFGDYFKKDAIVYAWGFLTGDMGLPADKLYASVYHEDQEAYDLWHTVVKLPQNRIVRLGAQDNFWQMGDTGPCGPCTEIYIDRGGGCGAATCAPGCSCDRFLEIWNLVFMQFNRQQDGTLVPLTRTGVDTGMGLDRLCAVLQNCPTVYETDLFAPIITAIEAATGHAYRTTHPTLQAAFRVLADHIRSSSLAIADGCIPGPDGRGYVLRKIIRRAALFAHKLSPEPFFASLVDGVIASLGEIYPALVERRAFIQQTLAHETEQFHRNLTRGKKLLEDKIATLVDGTVPGDIAFTLYDTYGFPLELTKIIAHEHGHVVDVAAFEQALAAQQQRSGKTSGAAKGADLDALDPRVATIFTGYDELSTTTTIDVIVHNSTVVDTVTQGQQCWIVPTSSPLYVECGGQISDQGTITAGNKSTPVLALVKQGAAQGIALVAPQELRVGQQITLAVDAERRIQAMKNHTATHLLQSALRATIGTDVKQAGSLVAPDYLRFDFTCTTAPSPETLNEIEQIINTQICENVPVQTRITTLAEAQKSGVIAFFGEKYDPSSVRVVEIPGISAELCGGTHVQRTGDIGCFKITECSALSAGSRRIVALTGPAAIREFQKTFAVVKSLTTKLKVTVDTLTDAFDKQAAQAKELAQQIKKYRQQNWRLQLPAWQTKVMRAGSGHYGIITVESTPPEELRQIATDLARATSAVWVVVGTEPHHERISFVATISPSLSCNTQLASLAARLGTINMRGSVSGQLVQGGAATLSERLPSVLATWLQEVA